MLHQHTFKLSLVMASLASSCRLFSILFSGYHAPVDHPSPKEQPNKVQSDAHAVPPVYPSKAQAGNVHEVRQREKQAKTIKIKKEESSVERVDIDIEEGINKSRESKKKDSDEALQRATYNELNKDFSQLDDFDSETRRYETQLQEAILNHTFGPNTHPQYDDLLQKDQQRSIPELKQTAYDLTDKASDAYNKTMLASIKFKDTQTACLNKTRDAKSILRDDFLKHVLEWEECARDKSNSIDKRLQRIQQYGTHLKTCQALLNDTEAIAIKLSPIKDCSLDEATKQDIEKLVDPIHEACKSIAIVYMRHCIPEHQRYRKLEDIGQEMKTLAQQLSNATDKKDLAKQLSHLWGRAAYLGITISDLKSDHIIKEKFTTLADRVKDQEERLRSL